MSLTQWLHIIIHIWKTDTYPEAQIIFGISRDGGKIFKKKIISEFDGNDFSTRIVYISEGKIALAAVNNAYI